MSDPQRTRLLELLRRHGWNATSFQVLEAGFSYWWDGDDHCVGYVDTGGAWVAAGAPIAPDDRLAEVGRSFVDAARQHGRRVCFFAAEARFADIAGFNTTLVGEQPVWDPTAWELTLRGARSLREQLRRTRAKGVQVRSVSAGDLLDETSPTRVAVDQLVHRWLAARSMAPLGFLVDVQLFEQVHERRYYVAERDGAIVGFLAAVPVFGRKGWFFEDLVRDITAPNGTTESLVDFAMRAAANEGSRYVTLGLAPLAGPVHRWLGAVRDRASMLYDFDGVRAFKGKLRPGGWHPIFLVHPAGVPSVVALYDTLVAFARGSFVRFGVATLLRGPVAVLRVLAAMLIPWTLALALAPRRLFPAAWVQFTWVLFDVGLTVAIFELGSHWRRSLALVVATAVTLDAVATLTEAILWNLPHLQRVLDGMTVSVAVAVPWIAAVVLWGAIRHRGTVVEDSSSVLKNYLARTLVPKAPTTPVRACSLPAHVGSRVQFPGEK